MLGQYVIQVSLWLATILPFVGGAVYARSIFTGKTRPQRTTYALFLLISATAVAALMGSTPFWLALASFVQAVVIFCLAIKFGTIVGKKFDLVCTCICILGIILWRSSGNALAAVAGCIAADFAAALPALIKTWAWPQSENWIFYALDSIASAYFVALGPYTVLNTAYPLYLFGINAVFVAVILCRRRLTASSNFEIKI